MRNASMYFLLLATISVFGMDSIDALLTKFKGILFPTDSQRLNQNIQQETSQPYVEENHESDAEDDAAMQAIFQCHRTIATSVRVRDEKKDAKRLQAFLNCHKTIAST